MSRSSHGSPPYACSRDLQVLAFQGGMMRERAPRLVLLCLHWGTERRVRVDALSAFTAHPDEFDLPLGHSLRYSHSRGRHCVQCRRMNVASCNDAGRPTNHPRPRCFAYLAHMNFSAQDTRSAGIDPLEKKMRHATEARAAAKKASRGR